MYINISLASLFIMAVQAIVVSYRSLILEFVFLLKIIPQPLKADTREQK